MSRRDASALGLVLLVYGLVLSCSFLEADEDLWGRMAMGRLIVSGREIPRQDVFAYVPTKPLWIDHEWLAGLVFFGIYEHLGGGGLVLLRSFLGLAVLGLAYAAGRLVGGAPLAVGAVGLAVLPLLLHGFNTVVRAQAFSFVLFALFLAVLESGKGRLLAVLVVASALWGNLHGGVVTGLLLLAVYMVRDRRLVIVLPLGLLATLVNPYGLAYWSYLAEALTMPRPEIVEWRSVNLSGLEDLHLKLVAGLVVLVVGFGRSVGLRRLLVLLGTLAASLLHVRFAPFLAIACIAFLPGPLRAAFEWGARHFPQRFLPSLVPLTAMLSLQALCLLGLASSWQRRDRPLTIGVRESRYPVAAVDELARLGASGRLAVFFNWGEFALYHLYPRLRASIDGRYETVYTDDVARANWDFTFGREDAARLLDLYGADFALYPGDSGAARWLAREPSWELVSADDLAALYQRLPTR